MQHQERALQLAKVGTGTMIDFSGDWKNELGSVMHLVQSADILNGTYTSNVSGTGEVTIGDLKGYVDGDLISFVVHWRDFQAITSWVGQIESGASGQVIKTLWQMTKKVAVGEEWASINAGSDIFNRV
ncbi:avidin/streptavidin family protein [Undibacterium sp. Ji67W]|uniref:avidin/streptavidin family protein n=1 Tax=Undibacterium sp. Ji67W TaxID=3413042 RepID=UPI003BF2FBA3